MKTEELTRTVALYQCISYGGFIVSSYTESSRDTGDYVRVSEPMTITLVARKQAEVMGAAVAAIDAQIVDAQQRVRGLEMKKAELLALPAPESA